jgi:FecR protein
MRKFWIRNLRLPGQAAQSGWFSPSKRSSTRPFGIAALLVVTAFFVVVSACYAQSAPEDSAAKATVLVANGPANQSSTQTTPPPPGQAPPPPTQAEIAAAKARVVRLSDVEGNVQVTGPDTTHFPQAVMNMPLLQGYTVSTGQDGRAEIEFEDGSVARITPNSSLTLTRLAVGPNDAFDTAVEQPSGLVYYELRADDSPSHYTVQAAGQTIAPTVNSTFRVNLGTNPPAVAVLDGALHVTGSQNSYSTDVKQNQTFDVAAANGANYRVSDGIVPNGFDDWNQQRDEEAAQEAQNQTPARVQQGGGSIMDSGFGWSDLDNDGGWYPLPGYGMVWQPYGAGPGFNPYGYGSWGYYGGIGYSWISGYPWGWLPFHCGSWSYIDTFGWGWMPGAYGCGGFGIGFGFGYGYGWYRHHPWHGQYAHTNIAHAPAGYRAPVAPTVGKGEVAPGLVRVGSSAIGTTSGAHGTALRHPAAVNREVRFNGKKIAPLHSTMTGIHVPVRNAALANNYPVRAFPGGMRTSMQSGSPARLGTLHPENGSSFSTLRGPLTASPHGNPFATHGAFGQHASFGPRGAFGGAHSAFSNGGEFRGGFRGSSGFSGGRSGGFSAGHSGGFSGGGFHGGGGGGGGSHGGGGGGGHSH